MVTDPTVIPRVACTRHVHTPQAKGAQQTVPSMAQTEMHVSDMWRFDLAMHGYTLKYFDKVQ